MLMQLSVRSKDAMTVCHTTFRVQCVPAHVGLIEFLSPHCIQKQENQCKALQYALRDLAVSPAAAVLISELQPSLLLVPCFEIEVDSDCLYYRR